MSVFPYGWTWSTIHRNLWSFAEDVWYGFGNMLRWAPVIWKDRDFDWHYLAVVMEYKLARMGAVFEHGHLMNSDRSARQCKVAAALLRRMMADNYDKDWESVLQPRHLQYFLTADRLKNEDLRYLTLLMRKHMFRWWD